MPNSGDKRFRRERVELLASILIGLAAVLTAIATYQSARLDGAVRAANTEALTLTAYANDKYNDANAQRSIERDWFFQAMIQNSNNTPAGEFMSQAMPERVAALVEEYFAAEDHVLDPFSEEAQRSYNSFGELRSSQLIAEGNSLSDRAFCAVFEGRVAEKMGEYIDLSAVFLSITLVTAGIAALLKTRTAQFLVLSTAVLCLVVGTGLLLVEDHEARSEVAKATFLEEDDRHGDLIGEELGAVLCPEVFAEEAIE